MVKVIEKEVCIVDLGFCGYAAYNNFKSKNINLVLIEGGEIETPKSIAQQPFYTMRKNNFLSIFEGKKIKKIIWIFP